MDGNSYIDCVSGFSVVNHGHCHPKIIKAFQEQSEKITMVSRALYSDNLGQWEEKICNLANKDKVLPMNTGIKYSGGIFTPPSPCIGSKIIAVVFSLISDFKVVTSP